MTINKEVLTKMIEANPDLANEYCVAWSGFVQYANHPNGYHSSAGIIFKIVDDDEKKLEGFKTKGEWRRAMPSKKVRSLTMKSSNDSYGYTAKSIKVSDLLKVIDTGWDLYSSNHVLWLKATHA